MERPFPFSRWSWRTLLFFASTAVMSIVWQHSIWVAVLLWLLAWGRGQVRPLWPKGPFALATLLLLATFFTGALFGVDPGRSFHTVHKNLTILLFFLVGAMGLDTVQARKLLHCFTYGAAFCGLWGIYQHLFMGRERMSSFGGHIMVFGGLLMTALLIQCFILLKEPRKGLHWAVLGTIALALIFNQTRGAWIGFAAGFLGLLWSFRRRWILPALALGVAAFFLLPSHYQLKVRSIWDFSLRHTNTERVLMWEAGWKMSLDHPVFGIGQDNVARVYPSYQLPGSREKGIPHLHNNFVQLLVQNGWLGFLAYLAWIGAYFWRVFRTGARPGEAKDWDRVLTWVFLAGLVWGLTEFTFSHQFMDVQFFLLGLQANLWRAGPGQIRSKPSRPRKILRRSPTR